MPAERRGISVKPASAAVTATVANRGSGPRRSRPAARRANFGQRDGQDRTAENGEFGDEADASRAEEAERQRREQPAPPSTGGAVASRTPAATKKNGPSSGQLAARYSCSGRSQGIRQWLAM